MSKLTTIRVPVRLTDAQIARTAHRAVTNGAFKRRGSNDWTRAELRDAVIARVLQLVDRSLRS